MLRCKSLSLSLLLLVLFFGLCTSLEAQAPQTADALLSQGKMQAAQEHKKLLLVFSASWCGPCKLYERFLEDAQMKKITEKAFVVVRFDVGERAGDKRHADTPGAVALRTQMGAAAEPGFPFIVMADADGKPLINSYVAGDTKNNIGYPVLPQEIAWYMTMIERSAPELSAKDKKEMRSWLEAHAPRM